MNDFLSIIIEEHDREREGEEKAIRHLVSFILSMGNINRVTQYIQ
jgi:hypothetical protein